MNTDPDDLSRSIDTLGRARYKRRDLRVLMLAAAEQCEQYETEARKDSRGHKDEAWVERYNELAGRFRAAAKRLNLKRKEGGV